MPRKRKVGRPKKKAVKRKVKRKAPSKGKRRKRRSGGQKGSGFFGDVGNFLGNVVGGVKDSGVVGDALLATGNPLFSMGAKLLGFGQKGSGSGKSKKLTKKQIAVMASDPRMSGDGLFGDFAKSVGKNALQFAKDNKVVSNALASKGHNKLAALSRSQGFGQSGGANFIKASPALARY